MNDNDTPRLTTAIPELAAMELTDTEFHTVIAAEEAVRFLLVERLKPQGASLRARIELAAAIMLQAIDHGYDAGIETGAMEPKAVVEMVMDLVNRRALEIWGQGGA